MRALDKWFVCTHRLSLRYVLCTWYYVWIFLFLSYPNEIQQHYTSFPTLYVRTPCTGHDVRIDDQYGTNQQRTQYLHGTNTNTIPADPARDTSFCLGVSHVVYIIVYCLSI